MLIQIKSIHACNVTELIFIVNQVEQVSPGFSEKYLMKPDIFSNEIEQYRKYISSMVSTFNSSVDADDFANDIVNFSTSLSQVTYFIYLNFIVRIDF